MTVLAKQRIGIEHEERHQPDSNLSYNESSYYSFVCPSSGVIGWVRMGLQHNQQAAQAGALIYLPDGRTLYTFQRVETDQLDDLSAGPARFEIVEPHREQRVRFDGTVNCFADTRTLVTPRSAFAEAPRQHLQVSLTATGRGEAFGTDGSSGAVVEETMSVGHYEQFLSVRGNLTVDGSEIAIDGTGLRDHCWGPRDLSSQLSHRWITVCFDDGSQMVLMEVPLRDGRTTREALEWRDNAVHYAPLHRVEETWTEDGFCEQIRCEVTTTDGPRVLVGKVRNTSQLIPLIHRGNGPERTRIAFGPYDFSDGTRSGRGIVEAMDQVVDGRPSTRS